MKLTAIQWIRNRSVFTKLLILFFSTAIIVSIMIINLMGRNIINPSRRAKDRLITASVRRFINELGESPNLESARRIGREYGIQIRYESPDEEWSTADDIPSSDQIHFHKRIGKPARKDPPNRAGHRGPPRPKLQTGFIKDRLYLMVNQGDAKFIISPKYAFTHRKEIGFNLVMVFSIILIFSISYFILRIILSPVKALKTGVIRVSDGKLDEELPVKNSDELGQLTQSFNIMINRLKEIISSKEQLLLDVSHELRTPLTRMKIAMEFLPDGKGKKSINEDVQELDTMLTELLESARLDSENGQINLSECELGDLLEQIAADYNLDETKVVYSKPKEAIPRFVDRLRIQMAIKNLVGNAVKYSGDAKQPVELSLKQTNEATIVSIIDYGEGIPKEALESIFEPFYRADKSRSKKTGGFGLGLSIVKQIIEAHKGSVEITSEEGKGTQATISLP